MLSQSVRAIVNLLIDIPKPPQNAGFSWHKKRF